MCDQRIASRSTPSSGDEGKESKAAPQLDLSFLQGGCIFDRHDETAKLREAFSRRIFPYSKSEFILISGKSGTGKTSLGNTLQQPVTSIGGFFVRGKFDQLQHPTPYSALVSAFNDFVEMLMARDEVEVTRVKKDILKGVGFDTCLLINMIPSLEKILGPQESYIPKGPDVRNILRNAFSNFVRAISSFDRPLVLLMDDLQWADTGSLDMITALSSNGMPEGLVIVGVCRGNEVSVDHAFARVLRQLEDEYNTLVTHIELDNLSYEATNRLVSNVLDTQPNRTRSLTDFLMTATAGNIFFTLQVLEDLRDNGLLFRDPKQGIWVWDHVVLNKSNGKQRLLDLVTCRMTSLPDDVRTVLMAAACIGAEFSSPMLANILHNIDVAKALDLAMNKSIVVQGETSGKYRFCHDNIQQAAYSLIPENERSYIHVMVGRRLWHAFSSDELSKNIFLVVNQMVQGVTVLDDHEEKKSLAALCLNAGKEAMQSSSFETAARYFRYGIDLLDDNKWTENYDLCLQLYNAAAEAKYCIGNFEEMDALLDEVVSYVSEFIDKVQAYSTRVFALTAQNQLQEALDLGLVVLKHLGENLPSKVLKINVFAEIMKTNALLRGKTTEDLLSLPDASHPEKIASMDLLSRIASLAFMCRPSLFPFIVCRFVRLSVTHGLCAYSAHAFCAYSVLCYQMKDMESAFRYGELSLAVLKRYGEAGAYLTPRVYVAFFGVLAPWNYPMQSVLRNLNKATKIAFATGDNESAGHTALFYAVNACISGAPLGTARRKLESFIERATRQQQRHFCQKAKMHLQPIHNFIGMSECPTKLIGHAWDESKEVDDLKQQGGKLQLSTYYTYKLMLACYFGDSNLVMELAIPSRNCRKSQKKTLLLGHMDYFYIGLAAIDSARTSKKKKHVKVARKYMKKVSKLAKSCPHIFTNKVFLLNAEFESQKGNLDASRILILYENSINAAKDKNLLHEHALACERTGIAMHRWGDKSNGNYYLEKAIEIYREWGATAKANQILAFYPMIREQVGTTECKITHNKKLQ